MSDLFSDKANDWDMRTTVQTNARAIADHIRKAVSLDKTMRVLDFGAGTGLLCEHLSTEVRGITAVDVSEAMLEQLRQKKFPGDNVEAYCRDIISEPLGQEFNLIVSAMALHHVEKTASLLQSFAGHLKAEGVVALADLDSEDGSFHPVGIQGVFHQGFDRQELESKLLAAGFKDVQYVTANTITKPSGSFPVFLVTARKAD